MKPPVFVQENAEIKAHFIIAEPQIQSFVNHLQRNAVLVQPAQHYLTDCGTEYFALEIQSGIPPQDGNQLVRQRQL